MSEKIDGSVVNPDFLSTLQSLVKEDQTKRVKAQSNEGPTKRMKSFTNDEENNLDFLMETAERVQRKTSSKPATTIQMRNAPTTPTQSTTPNKPTPYLNRTPTSVKSIHGLNTFDSPTVHKFNDRTQKFKQDAIFNQHIPFAPSGFNLNPTISVLPGQQLQGYRYMYERLTDKGPKIKIIYDSRRLFG